MPLRIKYDVIVSFYLKYLRNLSVLLKTYLVMDYCLVFDNEFRFISFKFGGYPAICFTLIK